MKLSMLREARELRYEHAGDLAEHGEGSTGSKRAEVMSEILTALETSPLSKTDLRNAIKGASSKEKDAALQELVDGGRVRLESGPRGKKTCSIIKPAGE